MASQGERQYEVVVFGASGYTGKYTAEHIVTSLPADLRWAVAGRSESKLRALVDELEPLNSNRVSPAIETASLEKSDLIALAKKTKVFISTVGPYAKYGSVVVDACAETGTHYLDVTGETPWVYDIVHKYHDTAKKNGAIVRGNLSIGHQIGVESAPADLIAWSLVSHIRHTLNVGTADVVCSTHELKSAPSGGTLATILSLFEVYSLATVAKANHPYSLSAIPKPRIGRKKSLMERLTGLRDDSDLGTLTTSIQGTADAAIVYRSWSLFDGGRFYGPKFHYLPYMRARNSLTGAGIHFAMTFGLLLLILPPVRWLLRQMVYQPGQGPTKEEVKGERVEWRAIATADTTDPNDPNRAFGRVAWDGSMYRLTGVCLAEAAIVIAREKTLAHEIGGGILTPATLGAPFVERLQRAGLKFEVRTMP